MIAAGCGDGCIKVYHSASGRLKKTLTIGVSQKFPTTSLAFRPQSTESGKGAE
ncbi:hypothetical protein KIPB_015924, partial [Kipferlia bialata]|eukprot:g15924.t1